MLQPRRSADWIFPCASTLFAGLAAATRISVAPATFLIWLFWIVSGKWKPSTFGLLGIAWVLFLFFLLAPGNFLFDLIVFHTQRGGGPASFPESSKPVLLARTIIAFSSIWCFGIVLAFHAIRSTKSRDVIARWWRIHSDVKIMWLAIGGGLWLVHFVAPANEWEYQIPSYIITIPLLVSVVAVVGRAAQNRFGFAILSGGLLRCFSALLPRYHSRKPGIWTPRMPCHVAENLARGQGFIEHVLWNYLDNPAGLPHPSNLYWMPLPSLLIAPFFILLGVSYRVAQIPFIVLSSLLPLIAFYVSRKIFQRDDYAWTSALFTLFSGFYTIYWVSPG
jgi:hypothetical protein